MKSIIPSILLASLVVLGAFAIRAVACCIFLPDDDGCCQQCCQHCGCQGPCHKVCHVVCETKEVKETIYGCRCEDFCLPGKSCKCGEECECDPCKSQWSWFDFMTGNHDGTTCHAVWQPSCSGDVRTRTKLIKYTVIKRVPSYRWVVEYCCDKCCQEFNQEQLPEGVQPQVPPDLKAASDKQAAGAGTKSQPRVENRTTQTASIKPASAANSQLAVKQPAAIAADDKPSIVVKRAPAKPAGPVDEMDLSAFDRLEQAPLALQPQLPTNATIRK